jgi:hypothetical protein
MVLITPFPSFVVAAFVEVGVEGDCTVVDVPKILGVESYAIAFC